MQTPAVVPIPHVGGPITGPGCPTVMIGGQPAAVMGDMAVCTGPPDTVVLGSTGVRFGGTPAARMGDQCAHGGSITIGCPTVMIGETASSSVGGLANMPLNVLKEQMKNMPPKQVIVMTQIVSMKLSAQNGTAIVHKSAGCSVCSNHS
jgi:uncharacterized Zn-binding protein involved in type VI secretion